MSVQPSPAAPHAEQCEIVLFHSVLGLRPGVLDWARRLREAGHLVHTPDLYDGALFDDYAAAERHVESIGGIEALMARTQAAVVDLPVDVVYAGFSNGGGSAELLALTRPGARGVVLMHAALPVQAFGVAAWPAGIPAQIHYAERDPFRQQEAIDALAAAVRAAGARYDVYDYPASGHLFADRDLSEFHAVSSRLMLERVLALVGGLAARS